VSESYSDATFYIRRRNAMMIMICRLIIIIINVVHEVQNKYKHKRKEKRKAKKNKKAKNMTVTTSLYAQIFYGRTDVIFANSTVL